SSPEAYIRPTLHTPAHSAPPTGPWGSSHTHRPTSRPEVRTRARNTGSLRPEKTQNFPTARPPHPVGDHSANGCSTGREVSVARDNDDGDIPARAAAAPRARIIAAQSGHSRGRGTRHATPAFAQRGSARARGAEVAAAPALIASVAAPRATQASTAVRVRKS